MQSSYMNPEMIRKYNIYYVKIMQKVVNLLVPSGKRVEILPEKNAFTDGKNIFVPFPLRTESTKMFHTLTIHEAFHILLTDFSVKIHDDLFPEETVRFLLNVVEDYRIEEYIKYLKPGYWFNFRSVHSSLVEEHLEEVAIKGIKTVANLLSSFFFFAAGHKLDEAPLLFTLWQRENPGDKAQEIFEYILEEITDSFNAVTVKGASDFRYHKHYPTMFHTVYTVKRLLLLLKHLNQEELLESRPNDLKMGGKQSGGKPHEEPGALSQKDLKKLLKDILDKIEKDMGKYKEELTKAQETAEEGDHSAEIQQFLDDLSKTTTKDALDALFKENGDLLDKTQETIVETIKDLSEKKKQEQSKQYARIRDAFRKKNEERSLRKNLELYKKENVKEIKIFDAKRLAAENKISDPENRYQKIVDANYGLIMRLQSYFSQIKRGLGYEYSRSGRLNSKQLSRYVTSNYMYDKVYESKVTENYGAHLLIMLDESGSMSCDNRIGLAFQTLVIIAEALKHTQINYAIVGFSAYYNKNVVVHKIYKAFNEPAKKQKIGTVNIGESKENRDGTSIQFIFDQYLAGLENPFLLVISDGSPWHGGTTYTNEHGIRATTEAVKYVRKHRTTVYSLFVGNGNDDKLQRIYKTNYIMIPSAQMLQTTLVGMLKRIAHEL